MAHFQHCIGMYFSPVLKVLFTQDTRQNETTRELKVELLLICQRIIKQKDRHLTAKNVLLKHQCVKNKKNSACGIKQCESNPHKHLVMNLVDFRLHSDHRHN